MKTVRSLLTALVRLRLPIDMISLLGFILNIRWKLNLFSPLHGRHLNRPDHSLCLGPLFEYVPNEDVLEAGLA